MSRSEGTATVSPDLEPARRGTDGPEGASSWLTSQPHTVALAVAGLVLSLGAGMFGVLNLRLGLGLVALVALVVVVLIRPRVGAYLLVGLVPALSGLAPGFLVPNVRISEVLIGTIGVAILVSTRRRDAAPWEFVDWCLLVYGILWAAFGAFDAHSLRESLGVSGWGTALGQLQFFLLYRALRSSLTTRRDRQRGLGVLVCAAVPMAMVAILQEVGAPGLRGWLDSATGALGAQQSTGIIRATGLFANWASLAGYFLPIVLVLVALLLSGQSRRFRPWFVPVLAVIVIGLLLTAELSVLVCVVLGVFTLGAQYGQTRRVLIWFGVAVAVATCIVGPVLGQRLTDQFGASAGSSRSVLEPQTIEFRMEIWTKQYLPAIEARPMTGYGEQLPDTVQWPYPESQYIALGIEGGLPMLLVYLALVLAMLDRSRRSSRSEDPVDRAMARALFVSVCALLAIGTVWPFASNGGLPQMLWCLLALVASPGRNRALGQGQRASRSSKVPLPLASSA